MATSGQTWKDMMGLGGISFAPKDSREALCHMQTFSPDFTSLLPSFNIPSRPFPRRSRTPLHGQAQMCSRPPFPRGSLCQHIPRAGHHRAQSWGAGELQWGAQGDPPAPAQHGGCGQCPSCPGAPSRRWPRGCGTRRSSPSVPSRGSPKDADRGLQDTPQPGEEKGNVTPPCGLGMPRNLLPAAAQPREIPRVCPSGSHPCPGGLHPLPELSSSLCREFESGHVENSGCGSKGDVPRSRGSPESSL